MNFKGVYLFCCDLLLFWYDDIGVGKGKYYIINDLLWDGIDDDFYEVIF